MSKGQVNRTKELPIRVGLRLVEKLKKKAQKKRWVSVAFLTRPVSLSCEYHTQCVKGCNSLGELCPWHKYPHGLWTSVEPFEWSQLFIPSCGAKCSTCEFRKDTFWTWPGLFFFPQSCLLVAEQMSSQVENALSWEQLGLWGLTCPQLLALEPVL